MYELLNRGLHSRNGFVRKGTQFLLGAPKELARRGAKPEDFAERPPVLANSFPKSGTHLLDQIVMGLPDRVNFGAFLSSYTSSFQYRLRTPESTRRFIAAFVPGEIVRGHLFYSDDAASQLADKNAVHYFIYRDPRDVVLSEAHYLRSINRWHRLHRYFRDAPSLEDAISLAIRGLNHVAPHLDYRNAAERFDCYKGWLGCANAFAIRFEELTSPDRDRHLERMVAFYQAKSRRETDAAAMLRSMIDRIAPERSHTFRAGKRGGWSERFTPEHRELFKEIVGKQLIELGYESSNDW